MLLLMMNRGEDKDGTWEYKLFEIQQVKEIEPRGVVDYYKTHDDARIGNLDDATEDDDDYDMY